MVDRMAISSFFDRGELFYGKASFRVAKKPLPIALLVDQQLVANHKTLMAVERSRHLLAI